MKILKAIAGLVNGSLAFVKAYDDVDGLTPSGRPKLRDWKIHDSPYEAFLPQAKVRSGKISAALIFLCGREKGSAIYLEDGRYSIGCDCTNDIVITTEDTAEARAFLEVNADGSLFFSESIEHPVYVNGHSESRMNLVDQDECQFQGACFYYLRFQNSERNEGLCQ